MIKTDKTVEDSNLSTGEKCGIFGVYGKGIEAARMTFFGIYSLQHRGQESTGISSSDGKKITTHKAMGLVTQVYNEHDLKRLAGSIAIGHNRYSTYGGSFFEHTQPVTGKKNIVALAHNGNLPETKRLIAFLHANKLNSETEGLSDSSLMHLALEYLLEKGLSLEDAIKEAFPLFTGAFCLLVMTKDKIAAVRDSCGIRPFTIGTINGSGYIFSSETCAIDTVGGKFLREVLPGEMVVVGKNGLKSYKLTEPNQKLDIFEFVYFSRPDSMIMGKRVYEVRKNLGKELAKEYPLKVDVIIPVPDSSVPAATGYSIGTKIPLELGLIKNRYVGRTFIMPDPRLRDRGVKMKLNPIPEVIKGKNIVLVDDSIVRGNTTRKLIKLVRAAGAKEVHLLISSPPVKFPDFYGIDTPVQKDLIGANKTVKEIEKFTGADSLYYLSYRGLIKATELGEEVFCTSCFTGDYPIDIGENKKNIKYPKEQKSIVVLISDAGTGTNLQAIIDATESKKLNAKIIAVISDKEEAYGLTRARRHNIPTVICPQKQDLITILDKLNPSFICLAGWKQIIADEVIKAFPNKILNTHPGLIPDTLDGEVVNPDGTKSLWNRGKMTDRAIQNFLDNNATYAGCSNHFLSNEFDFGKVLGRCFEKIKKGDTVDSLYERLKKKENVLYVKVLQQICKNGNKFEFEKATIT
jgi:amidophosphoribosyltransferase